MTKAQLDNLRNELEELIPAIVSVDNRVVELYSRYVETLKIPQDTLQEVAATAYNFLLAEGRCDKSVSGLFDFPSTAFNPTEAGQVDGYEITNEEYDNLGYEKDILENSAE